jgi:hypothetical protein
MAESPPSFQIVARDMGRAIWQGIRFMVPRAGKVLWWVIAILARVIGFIFVAAWKVIAWLWRHRPLLWRGDITDRQARYLADLEGGHPGDYAGMSISQASARISACLEKRRR